MLSNNWYVNRTIILVNNFNLTTRLSFGCSHPIWILEGIVRVLHLTNTNFPMSIVRKINECERQLDV
jgi:hypothetical protein